MSSTKMVSPPLGILVKFAGGIKLSTNSYIRKGEGGGFRKDLVGVLCLLLDLLKL